MNLKYLVNKKVFTFFHLSLLLIVLIIDFNLPIMAQINDSFMDNSKSIIISEQNVQLNTLTPGSGFDSLGAPNKLRLIERILLKDGFVTIDGKTADIRGELQKITGGFSNLSEKDAIQKIEVIIKNEINGMCYVFNNSIVMIVFKESGVSVAGGSPNDKSNFFTYKEAIFVTENGSLFAATPTTILGITSDGYVMGFDIVAEFGEKTLKMVKPEFRVGNDPNTLEVRDETFPGLKIVIHNIDKLFGVEEDNITPSGEK